MENHQVYPSINQSPKPERQQSQPTMAPQGQPVGQNIVYMPVYTQNSTAQQQPQGLLPQQMAPQPAPVNQGQCIEELKTKVQKTSKRVKCTSLTLMAFGGIGMLFSAHKIYGARNAAFRIIQGKRPFGPPDDEDFASPDTHRAFEEKQAELGSQLLTRDELAAYDIIKSGAFFLFILSILTVLLGKIGMWAQWRQKSFCSKRVSKKSMILIAFIFVFGLMTKNEAHDLHKIVRRYKNKSQKQVDFDAQNNQTESLISLAARQLSANQESKEYGEEFYKTEFQSEFEKYLNMIKNKAEFGDDEEKCDKYDEDSCKSDEVKCSWCKSAAVPPACHSVENARKLPSAVFQCDNLSDEEYESSKNEGPWGYTGKMNGHKHHDSHGHEEQKPPCMGMKIMGLAKAVYLGLICFHMFNHYSLFKSIKALDAKRVENGEVLSDGWGCHWGGKKQWKNEWKNKKCGNVNNTESASETASQMH